MNPPIRDKIVIDSDEWKEFAKDPKDLKQLIILSEKLESLGLKISVVSDVLKKLHEVGKLKESIILFSRKQVGDIEVLLSYCKLFSLNLPQVEFEYLKIIRSCNLSLKEARGQDA